MDDFKRCSHCAIDKHVSQFYKDGDNFKTKCIDCIKARSTQKKYKIARNVYESLAKGQEYKCAICKSETELVIDHCHKDGYIRGLLCSNCNKALGMFKDDIEVIESAIKYLKDI
jgi:hypothetical protein